MEDQQREAALPAVPHRLLLCAVMPNDPLDTNPELYSVVFENDRIRVLEYRDRPGDRTQAHRHPDSVMLTLSSFRRRLVADGRQAEVSLETGLVRWLPAQEHSGENIGDTETHVIFVELKERVGAAQAQETETPLGPALD
jgi:beta-alanine degradation protein BauB